MRKKLAAVLAVLALVAAMSIVPGQSALAQGPGPEIRDCRARFLPNRGAKDFTGFVACVMTALAEIPRP